VIETEHGSRPRRRQGGGVNGPPWSVGRGRKGFSAEGGHSTRKSAKLRTRHPVAPT